MSTHLARLPARYLTDTAQSTTSAIANPSIPARATAAASTTRTGERPNAKQSNTAQPITNGAASRMQAPGTATEHHARPAPNDHLCGCGRLRDECVRDTVRAVWPV